MHSQIIVYCILILALCLCAFADPQVQPATFISRSDGGWESQGLPYQVKISATGCIESLLVNGHRYL